jgi:hypothetical protein
VVGSRQSAVGSRQYEVRSPERLQLLLFDMTHIQLIPIPNP